MFDGKILSATTLCFHFLGNVQVSFIKAFIHLEVLIAGELSSCFSSETKTDLHCNWRMRSTWQQNHSLISHHGKSRVSLQIHFFLYLILINPNFWEKILMYKTSIFYREVGTSFRPTKCHFARNSPEYKRLGDGHKTLLRLHHDVYTQMRIQTRWNDWLPVGTKYFSPPSWAPALPPYFDLHVFYPDLSVARKVHLYDAVMFQLFCAIWTISWYRKFR